jgi:DNA-binding transcriptional LysR family regulator
MSKLPDLEGLAMFAKVAEERSFAGAARGFGVSVATVSRAVDRLEARLGGRLLNRTSRRLGLTEFGEQIATKASRILADAEEVENVARELSIRPRGSIRLAVPMSFGVRWVAPLLPEFLRLYPDIRIDLHLSDALVDIVGGGFDAALRIAVMEDSSLVMRRLCTVKRFIVASPVYVKRYGLPMQPDDLVAHHCLGYAYRARQDAWHLTNNSGQEAVVTPSGPLRVTNVDALIPALLGGQGIAELPEFIAYEYLADGRLQMLLKNWTMSQGGLHFVTPSARARPAKIDALSDFFVEHLSTPAWLSPRTNKT